MDKLVSFDIWDTIIKRKCHPEEVKLKTSRYIWLKYNNILKDEYKDIYKLLKKRNKIEETIGKENEKLGNDFEYKISDVFKKLCDEVFKEKVDISEELVEKEIEEEKEVTYLNNDIKPIFEKYKNNSKFCISDFYMGEKELKDILENLKVYSDIKKIYSSADYLLNKKSGKLYELVEKEHNITPDKHIHIGDNLYSDIEVANRLGIETIKIEKNDNFGFECERKRKFNFDIESMKINAKTYDEELYNIGIALSPILYFFVYEIIEYAILNKINKVYYFTREGETFIKIHELIKKNSPFEVEIPECEILEVSRMATFAASLKEISVPELLRLWSQYRGQSMKALFKTLNINIKEYKNIIEKHEIEIDEWIDNPWFDIRVQELFHDKEFSEKINKELANKKTEILEYMNKMNIKNDDKPLFVVDIGWRGTIQDNLCHIFDKKKIDGYYYNLFEFYNIQPENSLKHSFILNDKVKREDVARLLTLLEMFFNPNSGSVVGYKDGKAIRKAKTDEVEIVEKYTLHIQKGMFKGAEKINEYMKIHPYEASEFKEYVSNILTNLRKEPPKPIVECYYNLIHNDTFGTGGYVSKKMELSFIDKMDLFKCRRLLLKEEWKEAFFVHNNLHVLKWILNFKATLRKIFRR